MRKTLSNVIWTIWIAARLFLASVITMWLPMSLGGILISFGYHFVVPDAPKFPTEMSYLMFCTGFSIAGIGALYAEKKHNLLVRLSGVKKRTSPVEQNSEDTKP